MTAATRAAVPIVFAVVGDDHSIAGAQAAAELGVDALLVVPIDHHPARVAARLRSLASAAPGLSLILYHRPPLVLDVDDLARLCEVDALRGVKDGHRDIRRYRRLHEAAATRLQWISAWEDVALPFWAIGCDAFVPVSTAYAPEYSRAWRTLLEERELESARRLLAAHAYALVDLRLSRANLDVSVVKEAMEASGLAAGRTRPPAEPLSPDERQQVHRLVRELPAALEDASTRRHASES